MMRPLRWDKISSSGPGPEQKKKKEEKN